MAAVRASSSFHGSGPPFLMASRICSHTFLYLLEVGRRGPVVFLADALNAGGSDDVVRAVFA